MSNHSSTSSEGFREEVDPESGNLHEEASSEGTEGFETTGALSESDNEGKGNEGGIEDVEGFDTSRITEELDQFSEEVKITKALEAIPIAGAEEFGEPETVCGRDDRVRISPATRIPWRWICQLIITRADGGTSICTGWFIGPRTVMTSGHCVYSHASGGWARRIEIIPGMNGSSRPFGSQVGRSFRSVRGWTVNRDRNYDYGAIILPNNRLGSRVGWFGFETRSDSNLQNLLVNNSGYPGDKPFGTQWFNAGRITRVTARMISYMIDTAGGQSGSPVWRYSPGRGRYAVGIHGYGGCPNSAVRITRPVFDNMLRWKNNP